MTQLTLDVRDMPPARRHEAIFEAWETLPVHDVLELVNDHDPLPLYYQFQAEHSGKFTYTYVDEYAVVSMPQSARCVAGRQVRPTPSG